MDLLTLCFKCRKQSGYDSFLMRESWDSQTAFLVGSLKTAGVKRVAVKKVTCRRQSSANYLKEEQMDNQMSKLMYLNPWID